MCSLFGTKNWKNNKNNTYVMFFGTKYILQENKFNGRKKIIYEPLVVCGFLGKVDREAFWRFLKELLRIKFS
jgi:hypothetical protein